MKGSWWRYQVEWWKRRPRDGPSGEYAHNMMHGRSDVAAVMQESWANDRCDLQERCPKGWIWPRQNGFVETKGRLSLG